MSEAFRPAQVFHVWEYLQEEIDARNWTWADFKQATGADEVGSLALDFIAICDPRLVLDRPTAELIANAFGTSAELWLRLDETWRANPDRQSPPPERLSIEEPTP